MNLSRPKINALLALVLFTFVFLAAEFRFDVNVGLLAAAERVVIAQGFILGASVLGFIGYAPLLGLAQRKGHSLAAANAAVPIAILGLTQIQSPTSPLALEILGCLAFLGLGLLGAATHHAFSLAFQDDPKLATGAGAAYAAGILMQFAVNLLNCGGIVELIVLGAATIAISALGAAPQETVESPNSRINPFGEPSHALAKQACWSIALVMILACLFSTLDNVVTLSNAHGTIAVQTWPRLFLTASGLVAGIVFDLAERRYMGLIMIGALMLLVAASVAFVAAGLFRLPQTEQEREHQQRAEKALAAPSIEEQRQAFIANHALTPREVDVLIAVTQDERPLKQIAEELGISMRMVQRHLSSIYQKTDTQTRAGLTKAFPSA